MSIHHDAIALPQVPPGFEELAQGQQLWVDVSLYGKSLGLYETNINLEQVVFIKPVELAEAVKQQFNDDPALGAQLIAALEQPLPRNGHLACSSNGNAPSCDYLATQTVGIIYDENNARINLFLDRQYLPQKSAGSGFYQATVESENALVHQQNLNFVTDEQFQSLSMQGNGSLGVTENGYLNADWTYQGQRYRQASHQQIDVNNAYFRQDLWKRLYLQGGMMDSRDIFGNAGGNINLSQLPIGKIRGLRTGSTLAWINQTQVSSGTPVSVFLSRNARIDAYRDGQLLASFYLNAGAQELDTRTFPNGSYTVTLRVYEDNQLVRTETVPYTNIGVAQQNTFQWFLQAGLEDDNDARRTGIDRKVVQGGLRLPLSEALSLTAGSALLGSAHYWEVAADWSHGFDSSLLDGILTARVSYLTGSDGARGNIQQLNYNDGFSLSFYRSAMSAADCNTQRENTAFSGCSQSTNLMLSLPLEQWFANVGYSVNSNEGQYRYRRELPDNDGYPQQGAPWEQVYATRSRSHTWQLGVSRSFTVNDINVNTGLSAFTRSASGQQGTDKGGYFTVSLSFSGRNGGSASRSNTSLSANYQDSQRGKGQLSYNANYSRYTDESGQNEFGASIYGVNGETLNASTYARASGQYGNGSLNVSDAYDRADNRHRLSSSGSYSSSLLIDRTGLSWGRWGDGRPASAITVGVEGGENNYAEQVNVSVDGVGQADVRSNSRALFTVPSYQPTTFDINESLSVPAGISSEIRHGAGTRTAFMVPGKVLRRNIEVTSRYTWLGKMLDEQGKPLADGIPLNVLSWTPLGEGWFSLETVRPVKQLYLMRDSQFYQCALKVQAVRDVVRYVGITQCTGVAMANIPPAEQKQAQLMTVLQGHGRDVPVAMKKN
ncbi:TcfC E-set like domain-containing protein [Serratia fonticola]|uniref:TcfC E-set like domain-containing protein n=1 Tax=Serratia fonticola TaxID=47917 RepID=UPI0015C64683|nr:TcfC E-set like domain-containing protein [Serratia fonticola]MBC3377655.1 TcfC E-set like domain-containing protein [Serratia fonticola]NYA36855.1 TcfC E-set like domain-containing protein [Serratia fonticola]